MPLNPDVNARDHVQGDENAVVTLVQYGDFECPYSGAAFGAIREVHAQMGARLRYVFRPFPLHDIHPHATRAAAAAECAAAQGKFWPMYDLLFQNQDALRDADLLNYARQIGLDEERFTSEMQGKIHIPRLRESLAEGKQNGVHGTPTIFINGEFFDNDEGLWFADVLTKAIEDSLS